MPAPVLLRSALYLPASNPRALEKARSLACDALIFDLEDAVAPEKKPEARALLGAALAEGGYGRRLRLVRVNGAETPWGAEGLAAAALMPIDGVVLPKVSGAGDIAKARAILGDLPIWSMIETPQGVEAAYHIAAAEGSAGLILGANDLLREMGARFRADRLPLHYALQRSLMAARAAGIPCLDGVYNATSDAEGLAAECQQGRDFGFNGKTLIHPSQIDIANRAFSPSDEELALARRQIEAFELAMASGKGIAVVDGRIVENLHIVTARALLAQAAAIAESTE